jgi:hypothetical protein
MWRQKISLFMIFVFASLMLATLFSNPDRDGDCHEFGHIHHFHFYKHEAKSVKNTSPTQGTDSQDDCHAGQLLSGAFLLPAVPELKQIQYQDIQNEIVSVIKNHHPSPWLEPLRKPPKSA